MKNRCAWAGNDPLNQEYHDKEWGVPVYNDRLLFEFLILEGAQAGLNWLTVLRKRESYRKSFDHFDPGLIAKYNHIKINELMHDSGIIRNRLKIDSAIRNARAFLDIVSQYGDFQTYIWQFVDGKPKINQWRSLSELPAKTAESDAMSRDLKQRNFNFVGSTICYAFMQAVGMVNDHTIDCFRYQEINRLNRDK